LWESPLFVLPLGTSPKYPNKVHTSMQRHAILVLPPNPPLRAPSTCGILLSKNWVPIQPIDIWIIPTILVTNIEIILLKDKCPSS
jgi:hypothetical protein